MVLAIAWGQVSSWGVLYFSFPVFITPMHEELGWGQPAITAAFSLALLCAGFAGLVIGRILDRHGPRPVMTAGSIGGTLLVLAWSRVEALPAFYGVWMGIGVVMAMVLFEPAFATVAIWFYRYRSRALTIVTFVAGFASIVYLPLASALVERYGWRSALLILAAILGLATILPHALLLRRRPSDLGLLPDGEPAMGVTPAPAAETSVAAKVAIRSASFRWLTLSFCLMFLANVAIVIYLIPYLIDRGFSGGFAASAAAAIGLLALPGRLLITPLGGWVPRRLIACVICLCQAAALMVLVTTPTVAGVVAFVILFGAGMGAINPARAALVAEMYGAREYGAISGVLAFFVTVARAAGPLLAGALYAWRGSYGPVLWVLALASLAAAGTALKIDGGRR
jgi:MFS family permease